jgi:hypothetical protein
MFTESPAGKLEAQGRASAAAAAADKPISAKDKATIQRVLSSPGPGVQKVLDAMYSSKMAFSMFQDPEFESGLRQLLTPPLDQIFSPGAREEFNKGLALAAHPQAQAAIMLINLMKAYKQRCLEANPNAAQADGSVRVGQEILRVAKLVTGKIKADAGLSYVFEQLDLLGFYKNPAAQF